MHFVYWSFVWMSYFSLVTLGPGYLDPLPVCEVLFSVKKEEKGKTFPQFNRCISAVDKNSLFTSRKEREEENWQRMRKINLQVVYEHTLTLRENKGPA